MGKQFTMPFNPLFSPTGLPVPNGRLKFYVSESLDPMTVYADDAHTTPLGSYVNGDDSGRFPIIYTDAGPYRVIAEDSEGGNIYDIDPYYPENAAETGPPGPTGPSGTSMRSGIDVPDPALGNDGDFYINTTNYNIYGPKTAGAWGSGTSLVGPNGAGTGDMLKTQNLSGLASADAALANLGLSANAITFVKAANYAAMKVLLGIDNEAIQDIVGTMVADSATIDATYDDAGNAEGLAVIQTALKPLEFLEIALSDETNALTTGTAIRSWFFGHASGVTITDAYIGLGIAQSSSGAVTVNVKKNGTTIFSTQPSIASGNDTNRTGGGTLAVLSGATTGANTDRFSADIVAAGTGAKGLKLIIVYQRT